jgi:hypothetical protein
MAPLVVRRDPDLTATPNTGRIAQSSDRAEYKAAIDWSIPSVGLSRDAVSGHKIKAVLKTANFSVRPLQAAL